MHDPIRVHHTLRVLHEDKFNAKMSILIRSKTEGRLEVKSGYYTEKRMVDELKFSKLHCCTSDVTYSSCLQASWVSDIMLRTTFANQGSERKR